MVMKILKKTMPILSAVLLFIGCSKDAGQGTVPDGPGIEDGKIELSFGLGSGNCHFVSSS